MKIQNISNWLLVFFIHEISEYVSEANKLLDIIESNGCGANNELWVIYEKVEQQNGKGTYHLTVSRLLQQGDVYQLEVVPDWRSRPQTDRDSWKEAIAFIYGTVPSFRKILFTWSHGSGFGINVEAADPQDPSAFTGRKENNLVELKEKRNASSYLTADEVQYFNDLRNNLIAEKGVAEHQILSSIHAVPLAEGEYQAVPQEDVYDCKRIQMLWMHTLAAELKSALRGSQIDLLITMNCNTQLFENGYMLREVVKVLVGPESYMWAHGYAYQELLRLITLEPGISNKNLAQAIVQDYVAMHKNMGHHHYIDNTTMFANALEYYDEISAVLQETTRSLLARLENSETADRTLTVINNLKENYFYSVSGLGYLFLLDLSLWIKTVYQEPELSPQVGSYEQLKQLMQRTVLAKHIGSSLLQRDIDGPKKYGHSGCSLFFPPNRLFSTARRIGWCQYFSRQISSPFQQATLWDEFLDRIN